MKNWIIGILSVVAILFVAWATYPYWTRTEVDVVVTHVENKISQRATGREDMYLVYTSAGTFRNTDSLHYMKFNSADLQGFLAQKGEYRVTAYGFRIPILSMYKNIVKAEKSEPSLPEPAV